MFNPFKLLDPPAKRKSVPADYAGPGRDPFAAVPVRNELAEHKEDSQSCYQLRMRLPPGEGMGSRLANKLGLHKDVRIDLDKHGSFFWSQVDGRQDLHTIEAKLRDQFSLNETESREATLQFTKSLMLRHLIHLDIGGSEEQRDGTRSRPTKRNETPEVGRERLPARSGETQHE